MPLDPAWRAIAEGANLRGLAASGGRLAAALAYHTDLMPFYVADDEYDGMWVLAHVDQDLFRCVRRLRATSRDVV